MFHGRVALITGGATGIGSAIIKELASNQCNIVINYNSSEEQAKKLKEEIITNYNVKCLAIKCDLKDENQIKNMVDEVINTFGKIDILVNNAAIELTSDFSLKLKEDFMNTLEVNLIGPFLLSKYVSKYMLENKYGKIINIISNNAFTEYDPSTLEYDASKAGLVSLTHNLALELSPYINVNGVAPGWVMTEKVKKLNDSLDGMLEKTEKEKCLINRFVEPKEVAYLVSFLASDKACAINNEIIRIDGGIR